MTGRVKALCVFFVMYIFLLSGCARNTDEKQLTADFKAAYIAQYRGLTVKGRLLTTRQGNFNLNVSQPKTLEGLEADYKNGVLTLGRQGISCTADEAYLPQNAFPELLRQLLRGISDGRAVFDRAQDDGLHYKLSTDGGSCEITAGSGGNIKKLSLDSPKLSVTFSGVQTI